MGKSVEPSAVEREILPPDTGFSRKIYVNLARPSEQVLLSLVLGGSDRSSIHRPELCVIGQGWTVVRSSETRFRNGLNGTSAIPATVLEVQREVRGPRGPQIVSSVIAYWFVSSKQVVPSYAGHLALDMWQRLKSGEADRWAYVLMQTGGFDGETAALKRMQEIVDGTLPRFERAEVQGSSTGFR
jgi:hypothetical protein